MAMYNDDEILSVKNCFFTFAESLSPKPDGLPRNLCRAASDKKSDCDDMTDLYCVLDSAKVKLPVSAAVNMKRIMPATTGDLDVCSIAAMVSDVQFQLSSILSCPDKLENNVLSEVSTTTAAMCGNLLSSIDHVTSRLQSMGLRHYHISVYSVLAFMTMPR